MRASGSRNIFLMHKLPSCFGMSMLVSPTISVPSSSTACTCDLSKDTGRTFPLILRSSEALRMPSISPPSIEESAARKRALPFFPSGGGPASGGKTVIEKFSENLRLPFVRERKQSPAHIARRQNAELVAQNPGRTARVERGENRRNIERKRLEPAQKRVSAASPAYPDDFFHNGLLYTPITPRQTS